jgi:16S rRNA (guanine527-N7)-methyltransferase
MSNEILRDLLRDESNGLSEDDCGRILEFYDIIVQENEIQNLTRMISPADFYFGHVKDVLELLKIQKLEYPVIDMGSGVGIPGLMAALISEGAWVLAESEKRKAEYLQKATATLEMDKQKLRVFAGRAEDYLKTNLVGSIVARAVGPVERIYAWIRNCSTWNSLVLLKGPGWDEEWNSFQNSKYKKELKVESVHDYEVNSGSETKTRKIVVLKRVPRGTN